MSLQSAGSFGRVKRIVRSPDAPAWDDPISPATEWNGLIYVSGELGVDPATLLPVDGGITAQARQALANIDATLKAAGSSMRHVLKVNAYLRNADDYDAWNAVFAGYFPESPPARTTLVVGLIGQYLIEVDAVAYVPESRAS
jgi:2-iminobutanoate/2-iminopropanoate deaminase